MGFTVGVEWNVNDVIGQIVAQGDIQWGIPCG
jgi:hypothetical protein